MILTAVLYLLFLLFPHAFISESTLTNLLSIETLDSAEANSLAIKTMLVMGGIWLFLGATTILFGIAQLKLPKRLKHAKTAGILNIVSGATLIIIVGFIVMYVALLYEILLLFEASKKLEKKEKKKKKTRKT